MFGGKNGIKLMTLMKRIPMITYIVKQMLLITVMSVQQPMKMVMGIMKILMKILIVKVIVLVQLSLMIQYNLINRHFIILFL